MSIRGILLRVLPMAGGHYRVMPILIRVGLQEAMIPIPGLPLGRTKPLIGTGNGMDSSVKILKMPTWKLSLYLMIMKTGNILINIILSLMQVILQGEGLACRFVPEDSNGLRSLPRMLSSGITKLQILVLPII